MCVQLGRLELLIQKEEGVGLDFNVSLKASLVLHNLRIAAGCPITVGLTKPFQTVLDRVQLPFHLLELPCQICGVLLCP